MHHAAERECHTSPYPFKFGDGGRHIVLFIADYYYIVAVVRDGGCNGAAFQSVALYKPQPYPARGKVALYHGEAQKVCAFEHNVAVAALHLFHKASGDQTALYKTYRAGARTV